MRRNLTLLFSLFCAGVFAQNKTEIKGTLFNQETKLILKNKQFFIEDLDIVGVTDNNGEFSINVPEDVYQIDLIIDGFNSYNLSLTDSNNYSFYLTPKSLNNDIDLSTVVITSASNKSSEDNLLNMQRKSLQTSENIGSVELSRKGVSDAASAVTKISGITKQENGGEIYVRGLGDRYNYTSLNGLPIPSENPSNKNINLGIFSTDIIDYISVSKTFDSRFSPDFGGANINIVSKNYEGKGLFSIGTGISINSNSISNKNFMLQDGPSWTGLSTIKIPQNATSGYNFKNGFNPEQKSPLGSSLSLLGGKSFKFLNGSKLGFFAAASFSSDTESIKNGFAGSVDSDGVYIKNFDNYAKNSYNTNSTALVNLYYNFNANNKIKVNSIVINNSSQKLQDYKGYIRDIAENNNGFIRRGTYEKNTLYVNQLLGEHKLSNISNFNWGISYNVVKQDMPDRMQNTMRFSESLNEYVLASQDASLSNRYFQKLKEDEISANLEYNIKLGDIGSTYKTKISIGYQGRYKKRDFEANQFNLKLLESNISVDPNNLDAFFNKNNYGEFFTIETFDKKPDGNYRSQTYDGQKEIQAGFIELEYNFSEKFTALVALRGEYLKQGINWQTALSVGKRTFEQLEFLPNIALRYKVNNQQNLKFAASKTYTLPQFKELALFVYEDVTETFRGNPKLYPSENYNTDIKWELFPKKGEILSLTGFGKYIKDPINTTTIASSSNDISYANTGDWGYAIGAEIEYRKLLIDNNLDNLSVGFNATYMYSEQELNNQKVYDETLYKGQRLNTNFTYTNSAFTGASNLILNADLSYSKSWGKGNKIQPTVVYNYFSDKIYALGTDSRGHQKDKGFGTLDFILKSTIGEKLGINFSAKNILNPNIERYQENQNGKYKTLNYKKGVNIGLSVSYTF